MSDEERVKAFNPLDELDVTQDQLNQVLIDAFERQPCIRFPEKGNPFPGCGVYGLFYHGDYPYYEPISNEDGECRIPIYIGKAVPKGTRTGGAHLESSASRQLYTRLKEHRNSIDRSDNLDLGNFRCKYLVLSSIWIRYTEQLLISRYKPWWNKYIDGFGIHHPGQGRAGQKRSVWDTLHPGRPFVDKLDMPPRGEPEEVWENTVQPKIDADWSKEEVQEIDTDKERERDDDDLSSFV